jgi:hypothetical protein
MEHPSTISASRQYGQETVAAVPCLAERETILVGVLCLEFVYGFRGFVASQNITCEQKQFVGDALQEA